MTTSSLEELDRIINQAEDLLDRCTKRHKLVVVSGTISSIEECAGLRIRIWKLTMGIEAMHSLPPQHRNIGVLLDSHISS